MGEVIQFPARQKNYDDYAVVVDEYDVHYSSEEMHAIAQDFDPYGEVIESHAFLGECKSFLTEEDYVKVLCGILDREIYETLNNKLKEIVDNYFLFC